MGGGGGGGRGEGDMFPETLILEVETIFSIDKKISV